MRLETKQHSQRKDVQIYELWDGMDFIAAIYPTERGLRIVSKYIENQPDLVAVDPALPPSIVVNFK